MTDNEQLHTQMAGRELRRRRLNAAALAPRRTAPLTAPARQAAELVRLAEDLGGTLSLVRALQAGHVEDPTERPWPVEGHDQPMTASAYARLVLAELDKIAASREG